MGNEVLYCSRCANRIGSNDFSKGAAFRRDGRVICSKCLPGEVGSSIDEERKAVPPGPPPRKSSSTRIRAMKRSGSTGVVPRATRPAPPAPSSKKQILIACAVGGVILVAGAAYFFSGSSSPPPDLEPSRPLSRPTAGAVGPKGTPKSEEKKAEEPSPQVLAALAAARAKQKDAPDDLDGQILLWEEAAKMCAPFPELKEASTTLGELKTKRAARTAKKEAQRPAAAAPPSPDLGAKPASPAESKAYLARWQSAIARASAREYEDAISDLERAGTQINEDAAKRDATADVEDLRRVVRARAEALSALARTAVSQNLSLDYRSETGQVKHVEGSVLRIGPSRVELKQKDKDKESSVIVEWADVTAATLAAQGSAGSDGRRGLALLCILEGDRPAAERALGDAPSSIPARYWDYAKDAASNIPKMIPRELEARRLFYPAEREWEKPETRAAAIAKYKTLIEEYTSTAVVKEDPARVRKRAESALDYVLFAGALKGSGVFAVAPAPKIESAWTVKSDAVGSEVSLTFVDADFIAAQDLAYKCWVYVGGCCAETFLFYLQTTDATVPDPKTGKTLFIEPGGGPAVPVKHAIQGLPKNHAAHKPKVPKSALRWEWVAIPLPKYPGPGQKKIRLLSDQQGFSVGAVVVSSKRSAPPSDAEIKDELARMKGPGDGSSAPGGDGGKAWRPVFDGKSLDCVRPGTSAWRFENGAIAHVADLSEAGQTREEFGDVELRIRFEVKEVTKLYFKLRQGSGGGYSVLLEDGLKALEGKPHEIIFLAAGDKVTATLDGSPVKIQVDAPAQRGCLQFNAQGKTLNILAIDAR